MTTITLDEIKVAHSRVAEMIEKFEAQTKTRTITIPGVDIELKDGERYAGIVLGDEGECNYHLIMLPGEADSVTWQEAKDWAASIGGELPNRREQALAYANLKEEFQSAWYWSSVQHAGYSRYAWCQYFYYGNQNRYYTNYELRARAFRRLIIQ